MRKEFNDNWMFSSDQGKTWTKVTLPHDAQMTLARTPDAGGKSATGFFPGGDFLYKKTFTLTKEEAAGHIEFEFGGVYKHAHVKLNGIDVEEKGQSIPAYGYLPFRVYGDGLLKEGENTIEVFCSNAEQPDSRWYSGAGIYRPVWIDLCGENYIVPGSIRIKTVAMDTTAGTAEISVSAKASPEKAAEDLSVQIMDPDGNPVYSGRISDSIQLTGVKFWSAEEPNLYTAELKADTESTTVRFGIREITKNRQGLFVNGKPVPLRGGCIHADNGVIGAREFYESEKRRIRILKDNGFNAIRCSHNPASEELLRACDELGMYVMDEMWDMWYRKKNKYDYANDFPQHYRDDIRATVDKDFNHPSVVLYSIGNEVSEPGEKKGVDLAAEMVNLFHELDPSRLVTGGMNLMIITRSVSGKGVYSDDGGRNDDGGEKMSGMNSTMFNMIASMVGTGMNKAANNKKADAITSPVLDTLDIAGYNYASGRYPKEGKLHPDRVILGSETFPQDIAKNWAMVKKYPYLVGDFMWTAWDYLGEAGIGAWSYSQDAKGFDKPYPWLLAEAGAFDITGKPNGEALWAKAVFEEDGKPYLAVQPMNHPGEKLVKAVWRGTNAIPSWNYKGCDGNKCIVEVYSTAPYVVLSLNGKKIGRKKTKEDRAIFKTAYAPGILKAESFSLNGDKLGEDVLTSGTGKTGLSLTAEEKNFKVGDILYVDVDLVNAAEDNKTVSQSNEDIKVKLAVKGAELLGFGSANPRTEERYDAGECTTYYGHALAVLRVTDQDVIITAEGENRKAELTLIAAM